MEDLKARLEEFIAHADESEEATTQEATRLLTQLLRVRAAADSLLASSTRPNVRDPERPGSLLGLSLHEAARMVLEDAGSPLHARELGRRIKQRGWKHPRSKVARPDQIVFQLAARLPRVPETFVRTGPNTFGLRAWEGRSAHARPKPRVPLFSASGSAAASSSAHWTEPFESEQNAWRSS